MSLKKVGYSKYLLSSLGYGASFTIIQSVIWIVLTCIGLAVYHDCSTIAIKKVTVAEYFTAMIKFSYYNDFSKCKESTMETFENSKLMVKPFEMMIWNCVYLGFSCVWLITSILAISKIHSWKTVDSKYPYAIPWIICTVCICILDLILGSFLGADIIFYQSYKEAKLFTEFDQGDYFILLRLFITGIMMTVAVRGFVIWILNLFFAVYVTYGILDLKKAIGEDKNYKTPVLHNTLTRGPISAYENSIEARSARWLSGEGHVNRPHLQHPKTPSVYGHRGSYHGEVNPSYAESFNSFNTRSVHNTGYETLPLPDRSEEPWNKELPTTPKPDYSPQPIRAMRSALKPVPATKANHYIQ